MDSEIPWVQEAASPGLGEPGLLSEPFALCLGDSHPRAGSCTDQVCLEFDNHGQNIEKEPAYQGLVLPTTTASRKPKAF